MEVCNGIEASHPAWVGKTCTKMAGDQRFFGMRAYRLRLFGIVARAREEPESISMMMDQLFSTVGVLDCPKDWTQLLLAAP
jgi:hypothetical protein